MKGPLKAASAIAALGVSLSAFAFTEALREYLSLDYATQILQSIAPLEKDYVAESIEPFVRGKPQGDSALKLVQGRLREAKTLHGGWLNYVESWRPALRNQCFLWAGAFVAFAAVLLGIRRTQHSSQ
jgi:hypothetical protein